MTRLLPDRRVDPEVVRRALAQRLRAAADVLLAQPPVRLDDPAADAAVLLERLVDSIRREHDVAATWLLLVALSATFPTDDDVRAAVRQLELGSTSEAMLWFLETSLALVGRSGSPALELEIVVGGVLVDVDYSAQHDLNTGIQRVVRQTAPRWQRDHDITLVAWTPGGAMRSLTASESSRVLSWRGVGEHSEPGASRATPARTRRLVAPWRSVVVLPEVPSARHCAPLAALAEHSGNRVSMVGYDCIPVVSADVMPPAEPTRFVKYLTIVKHANAVSGISGSAAAEFRGFATMLPAQGLAGPRVSECVLPVEVPDYTGVATSDTGSPLVVCVGSHEPRKNHLAVIHAAETLWREGLEFRLEFIGGPSWASDAFDAQVRRLAKRGRQVVSRRGVSDTELWATYQEARFSVFPSLHEGFGLPVAESLALGTPALTSNYGSTREISTGGGTVMVDPRDDAAVIAAMRTLLTDDALLARLTAEAADRPRRTWDDYAVELWQSLVAGVQGPAADAEARS